MLLLTTLAAASSFARPTPIELPPCTGAVVGSYNVNYGLAGDAETLDAAAALGADILVVQEVTPEWARALAQRFGRDLPHQLFLPDPRGAGGLAVLSRWPVAQHAYVGSPIGWFPGWVLHVQTPRGPLQVLTVHLRPPVADTGGFVVGAFTTGDDRLAELQAYVDTLAPELPTVIAGDFNERTGPSISLLDDLGYTQALPPGDTWRWPTPVLTLRNQLDHLFISPGLEARDGAVLDLGRSDHLPVRATVCW